VRDRAPGGGLVLNIRHGATGGAVTDIKFQLPALERLSRTVGEAYSGTEIVDMFRRAGFGGAAHGAGAGPRSLHAALERLQRDFGAEAILEILKVACDPRVAPGRGDVREGVNECLSLYGLRIDGGGELRRAEAARADPDGDREAFVRRNYHRLVTDAARAGFLRGDYVRAVSDSCRELERLVRGKSGLELSGKALMASALDPKAGLELSLPRAAGAARDDVQEGIMHMCMGIVASARSPVAHGPERGLPMDRDDALDMLGVISHLCRQVDRMRPRGRG